MADQENDVTNEYNESVAKLQGLLKSDTAESQDLQKAEKEKDDDKDDKDEKGDEYNESYMKKYMKKFMANNPDYASKMGKMKKALDNAYDASESDMAEAEAVMLDGTEMFQTFKDLGDGLLKAFSDLSGRLESIEQSVGIQHELSKASGTILVKAVESLNTLSSVPKQVKGQLTGQTIQKADNSQGNLQKASSLGIRGIKDLLLKAVHSGNHSAGTIITEVESCRGNLTLLPGTSVNFINSLIPQEV